MLNEKKKINNILKLKKDTENYGGLWKNNMDIEKKLKLIPHNYKKEAVKIQLKYHKTILCSNAEKSLFSFSSKGIAHSIENLISNLKTVISETSSIVLECGYCVDDVPVNPVFKIKNKQERDIFMKRHRLLVLRKVNDIKQKYSKLKSTKHKSTKRK